MKKIIVVGASSGMGYGVARLFIQAGWQVAVCARRVELLESLKSLAPERVVVREMDVCADNAVSVLEGLLSEMGGVDCYFHAAGLGLQNPGLLPEKEDRTVMVNVAGFSRLLVAVFNYMKSHGGGHIGIISSVAGTRGMGVAPSYSATKRFQYTYVQALSQLSSMERLGITFTDIRPGFVATDFLDKNKHYPLMMGLDKACNIIYRALIRKKRICTFDWKFRIVVFIWKCIPLFLWEKMNVKNS